MRNHRVPPYPSELCSDIGVATALPAQLSLLLLTRDHHHVALSLRMLSHPDHAGWVDADCDEFVLFFLDLPTSLHSFTCGDVGQEPLMATLTRKSGHDPSVYPVALRVSGWMFPTYRQR